MLLARLLLLLPIVLQQCGKLEPLAAFDGAKRSATRAERPVLLLDATHSIVQHASNRALPSVSGVSALRPWRRLTMLLVLQMPSVLLLSA